MNGNEFIPNFFLAMCLLFFISACDTSRQYEEYQIKTEADLTLSSDNHPHGYQKTECFLCHHPENIHQVNRLGLLSFDYAQTLVRDSGLRSCQGCHGKNGAL